MENLRKINRIDGWKRVLLNFSGYNSIIAARREYINYTDKEIYEEFKENYNKTIEEIQKNERNRKVKEKRKNSILPFRNSEIEPLGQPVRKQNRTELIPYKVNIEISGDVFHVIDPKTTLSFNEVLTEGLDGNGQLIIPAKTP